MRRKGIISVGLVCSLLLGQAVCLTGCGEQPADTDEVIELIDPMREFTGSEIVSRRDLYEPKVYDVLVEPYVEEYSYEENRNFLSTNVAIGDTVKAGDLIYNANILSAETQIEKLQEKLADLTESYEEYRREMEETLSTQRQELEVLEEELEEVQDSEPEKPSDPGYAAWQKDKRSAEGSYSKKELDVKKNEEALRQRTGLYRLDYDYYAAQIKSLRQQGEGGELRAGMDGQIVAMNLCNVGDQIRADSTVVSIADMNQKRFVCNNGSIGVGTPFALFNGKKYEVAFDYQEQTAPYQYNTYYKLKDPEGEVPVGSYGKFVLYTRLKEQVVTVPSEALHMAGTGHYVYVIEDGQTVVRTVKIGMNDGVYMEILSGLEEGEVVLMDRSDPQAVNTAVLGKGRVALQYYNTGSIYYPIQYNISCDVKHGTVIFDGWPEYSGRLGSGEIMEAASLADVFYMPIKAGDVIARIKVELDEKQRLELQQKETNLKRLKERFADYVAAGTEGREKAIASRQAAIDQAEEELAELYADYNATEVRAEKDGLLMGVQSRISGSNGRGSTTVDKGDKMASNFMYARMADNSVAYLLLPDKISVFGTLGYNTMLDVSYVNWQYETVIRQAPVVNVGIDGASQALLLDSKILRDINVFTTPDSRSMAAYQTTLSVTGEVRVMDNVVLVPVSAVKEVSTNFGYVNVLEKDGSIRSVSVVLGGKFTGEERENYYWVIDGMTEGMTVCWE